MVKWLEWRQPSSSFLFKHGGHFDLEKDTNVKKLKFSPGFRIDYKCKNILQGNNGQKKGKLGLYKGNKEKIN